MGYTGLILSTGFPLLLGFCLTSLLLPSRIRRNNALLLGYGYFLGIFLVTLFLRLAGLLGFPLHFPSLLAAMLLLSLPVFLYYGKHYRRSRPDTSLCGWRHISKPSQALILLFLLAILLRLATILVEIVNIPLYPWDAWVNWAPKTKVWFHTGELHPFVSPEQWLTSTSPTTYTLAAWHYPETIPLIQLWTVLSLGYWDSSLISLHWLFCALFLGLAFFGQLREAGISCLGSTIASYLLFSIPLLNIHTALAGYADIWLSAFFTLGAMSLMNSEKFSRTQLILLVSISALASATAKTPGILFAFLLMLQLLALLYGRFLMHLFNAGLALAMIILASAAYLDLDAIAVLRTEFSGPVLSLLTRLDIGMQEISWAIPRSLFLFNSWNILWYLMIVAFILFIANRSTLDIPAQSLLLGVYLLLLFIFQFTRYSIYADNHATFSRAMLYVAPLSLYWMALLTRCLNRREIRSDA